MEISELELFGAYWADPIEFVVLKKQRGSFLGAFDFKEGSKKKWVIAKYNSSLWNESGIPSVCEYRGNWSDQGQQIIEWIFTLKWI